MNDTPDAAKPTRQDMYSIVADTYEGGIDDVVDALSAAGFTRAPAAADGEATARDLFALRTEKSAVRHYLSCALGYDGSHPELAEDLTVMARQIKAMAEMAVARREWPTSSEGSVFERLRQAEASRDAARAEAEAMRKALGEIGAMARAAQVMADSVTAVRLDGIIDKVDNAHHAAAATGSEDEYCVARRINPDGSRLIGKGPTFEAARADLAEHVRRAEAFAADDPMDDWSKLPTEPVYHYQREENGPADGTTHAPPSRATEPSGTGDDGPAWTSVEKAHPPHEVEVEALTSSNRRIRAKFDAMDHAWYRGAIREDVVAWRFREVPPAPAPAVTEALVEMGTALYFSGNFTVTSDLRPFIRALLAAALAAVGKA